MEVRNLLAANVMPDDSVSFSKEDSELDITSIEQWDEESRMTFRTLDETTDPSVGNAFLEREYNDPLHEESIYLMSMPAGFDESALFEAEVFDGELLDTDGVLYSLMFETSVLGDNELFSEEMLEEAVVSLGGSDEGEIRYFGSSGVEDAEIFSTGVVTFMSDWYNADDPMDTNVDGITTALDALIVFNALGRLGSVQLSHELFDGASPAFDGEMDTNYRVDGNNDGYLSPLDALLRINFLAEVNTTDEMNLDASRLGGFASILPGEWDQYEPVDSGERDEAMLSEDNATDESTAVFGSRIWNPELTWPKEDPNDAEADNEFWSDYEGDKSDALLDDQLLELLTRA